jgi:hypothetical protein
MRAVGKGRDGVAGRMLNVDGREPEVAAANVGEFASRVGETVGPSALE